VGISEAVCAALLTFVSSCVAGWVVGGIVGGGRSRMRCLYPLACER
jgi:hypothetical protein